MSFKHQTLLVAVGLFALVAASTNTAKAQQCNMAPGVDWEIVGPVDEAVRTCKDVGIGTPDGAVPIRQLHLHTDQDDNNIFSMYTNQIFGHTDLGFKVGMDGDGFGRLWHPSKFPITVWTSNVERMRVTPGGLVGINTTMPTTQLHVAGNNGFITSDPLAGAVPGLLNPNDGLVVANAQGTLRRKVNFTGNANDVLLGDGTFGPSPAGGGGGGGGGGADNDWTFAGADFMFAQDPTDQVGIGLTAPGNSKLTVVGTGVADGDNNGAYVTNSDGQRGLYAICFDGALGAGTGVRGEARSNFGTVREMRGVVGFATGSTVRNHGVEGIAETSPTSADIGVFGDFFPIGTGTTGQDYAGFFNGDVQAGLVFLPSDRKLKENIQPLNNALSIIDKLQPKTYNYKQDLPLNLPGDKQYGLIVQEVAEVLPELTQDATLPARYNAEGKMISDAFDYKSMEYNGLIPILLQGIKEQQAQIDQLQAQLDALSNGSGQHKREVTLQGQKEHAVILNQNDPNPFREHTTIRYQVPTTATSAKIVMFGQGGSTLKAIDVEPGNGSLEVYASDLNSGIYTYSIVVDGKVIDSKRMVVSK